MKMFTNQSEFGAMQREMNAIRSIPKHDNIVQCLETEEREVSCMASYYLITYIRGVAYELVQYST